MTLLGWTSKCTHTSPTRITHVRSVILWKPQFPTMSLPDNLTGADVLTNLITSKRGLPSTRIFKWNNGLRLSPLSWRPGGHLGRWQEMGRNCLNFLSCSRWVPWTLFLLRESKPVKRGRSRMFQPALVRVVRLRTEFTIYVPSPDVLLFGGACVTFFPDKFPWLDK